VGTLSGDLPVLSRSTDSRSIQVGEVFAALRGENFNGNDYIESVAKNASPSAIICETAKNVSTPQLVVPDTLRALIAIARELRKAFPGPVFAISGSAGKSSTKEALATILGGGTLASPASFNNLLGISKTWFLISDDIQQVILEVGMNGLGEIKEICETFMPTGGLLTNIGDAHIGKLGGQEGIYRAKKEMFDYLASRPGESKLALNADDPLIQRAFQESFGGKALAVTFSTRSDVKADIRTLACGMDPKTGYLNLRLSVLGSELSLKLPIYGLHFAQNICAAVAAGVLFGIDKQDIAQRLEGFRPASHRGHIHQLKGERILVDESYNSNPTALISSLRSCAELDPNKKRVFVLGEMRELGSFSQSLHEKVGAVFAELFVRIPYTLIGVGPDMKFLLDIVRKHAGARGTVVFAETADEALKFALAQFEPGAICLVKGSRGVKLEKVVAGLTEN